MALPSALLAAAVALALALAGAAAAQSTKGTTLRGFTFATDAAGPYLNVSRDIADIRNALNRASPDYLLARDIYTKGRHARNADGSMLTLRQLALKPESPGPFWAEYAGWFEDPNWLDGTLQDVYKGGKPFTNNVVRVNMLVKTLESSLQVAALMQALDSAVALTKQGKKDAALGELDKAWALFVGGEPKTGLLTVTVKRAGEYGTKTSCDTSEASDAIGKAFSAAQKAVRAGDAKAVEAARRTVRRQLTAVYVQAVVTYAHEMYLDREAGRDAAESQAQAYAFFRTIAPLVERANETSALVLDNWFFPGEKFPDDVDLLSAIALAAAYKDMGITQANVGVYGAPQPQLKCTAAPRSAAGDVLQTTVVRGPLRGGAAGASGVAG